MRILFTIISILSFASTSWAQGSPPSTSLDQLSTNSLLDQKAFDNTFGKLPTTITSDSLSINAKQRIFTYKGNVVVTQGDLLMTSKIIEGSYNESNQIQKLVAKGDVVISKQEIKATSQQAIYDAITAIVTLTDNPQLQQQGTVLIADRIKIFLNENRSQAEGSVRVTVVNINDQGGSEKKPLAVVATTVVTPVATPVATPLTTPLVTPATTPATTPTTAQPVAIKKKSTVKSKAKSTLKKRSAKAA